MEPLFGIVIPTKGRCRFLPGVIRQVRAQSYANWRCVIACDGHSRNVRHIFDRHVQQDRRFELIERPRCAEDWGYTPRGDGLARFQDATARPDYVLFWDDDNAFYPGALGHIREAVNEHPDADVLLVPMRAQQNVTLPRVSPTGELISTGVDTANLVVRFSSAIQYYGGDMMRGQRGTDHRFFQRLKDGGCQICKAGIPPIGLYDGLRGLATLRWRLGIPPLGLSRQPWFIPIRRLLRG